MSEEFGDVKAMGGTRYASTIATHKIDVKRYKGGARPILVEMILLVDEDIQFMAIERSIKNLILLVLAIIIVAFLWKTMWFLGGLAIFIVLVYFVYLLLKGSL